jgi:trehalose 6-phosphate phosphatase
MRSDTRPTFIDDIDVESSALLLDIDGTLLDIAPTPLEVRVPPMLRTALDSLRQSTRGAVAFVSGRPVSEIDLLFAPLKLPAVGGHGAEVRTASDEVPAQFVAPLDSALRSQLAAFSKSLGILFEDKGYSFAIHYRIAPQHAAAVREAVTTACAAYPADELDVLLGKSVIEVKSSTSDKGSGIRQLMKTKPFLGRRPIFLGDDITDEAAFAVMPAFDGLAFSVGREVEGLAGMFRNPGEVRAWLYHLAGLDESSPA